ncbi:DNA-binding HxlR family transcriptional regulator [Streptacidiphilus sp. MAP12-20]|uniref:winged helix-turn-helix transcriptional regulator n=1 Tax=Streptacidiphilus sp. MAP12-20 TaxID=3156299 RepID=UPI0035190543
MTSRKLEPRPCSIADTLGVVGEKYALLVLREALFGVQRFDAIARNVGAPRDILTARLRRLVEAGLLEKVLYQERPPRYEYRPTPAGRDLQPVLMMLKEWGDRHLAETPPLVWEHNCGADVDPVVCCRACGERLRRGEVTARYQVPGWSLAGPVED